MPRCTVCHHPQLLEINQAILSKDFTLAVLSRKYGLHPSSLQRHKNHIEIKMSRSLRRLREIREQGSLLLLNDILEQVRRNIAAADAQGNYLAVFRGSHTASRLIHQMGRLEGNMQLDTLHRLISSPAWAPGASLLPTDPKLMAGLHQGLLDGAFAPCPEPPPEISAHDSDEANGLDLAEPFLETGNSALETGLATLRRFLPDLDRTLADLPPRTEELPKNQRKMSEKAAANDPPGTEKDQQYQDATLNEKNQPKNPESALQTAASVGQESTRKGGEAQAPHAFRAASVERDPQGGDSPSAAPPFVSTACAPAAFSGISYDPFLPAPATANSQSRPSFLLPPADPPTAGSIPHPSSLVYAPYASHPGLSAPEPPATSTTIFRAPETDNRNLSFPVRPEYTCPRGSLADHPGPVSRTRPNRSPPPLDAGF